LQEIPLLAIDEDCAGFANVLVTEKVCEPRRSDAIHLGSDRFHRIS